MPITDWPTEERPREKLLARGAGHLSDAELLAIFLRTGTPGRTALDLARELLTEFGDLRRLLEAPLPEFSRANGLGPAKYAQLQASVEMSRRYLEAELRRGSPLTNTAATRRYFATRLRHYPYEVFCVLYLDNSHRVIRFEELFRGTVDGTAVHAREVVRQALAHNAAAVIFAHNHPSGAREPSRADVALTERLANALGLMDIRVLDHFVVGDGEPVSLAELGLV
ncbi:RadC family protein [Endothiovibrio diazotrophicus]